MDWLRWHDFSNIFWDLTHLKERADVFLNPISCSSRLLLLGGINEAFLFISTNALST